MGTTLGRTARRFHVLLLLAVAAAGVGVLLVIVGVMLGGEEYSRGLAGLALMITLPLWVAGIAAAVEALAVFRGRRVTRLRALIWALVVGAGAAVVAVVGGQVSLAITLLTRPDLVGFDWPAIALIDADRSGARYLYVDQAGFWLPIAALVLGVVSLLTVALDRSTEHGSSASPGRVG